MNEETYIIHTDPRRTISIKTYGNGYVIRQFLANTTDTQVYLANEEIEKIIRIYQQRKEESTPKYEHNCKECVYLGAYKTRQNHISHEQTYDLYWCKKDGFPVILSRYGDNRDSIMIGVSYYKSFFEKHTDHPESEAYRRAKARGLEIGELQ